MRMNFNVSKENVLRMFTNEYRERLVDSTNEGGADSLSLILELSVAALKEVLDVIDSETSVAKSSFEAGALDSRRESRGLTGPGVVSSQEVKRTLADDVAEAMQARHTFAENVTNALRQDPPAPKRLIDMYEDGEFDGVSGV